MRNFYGLRCFIVVLIFAGTYAGAQKKTDSKEIWEKQEDEGKCRSLPLLNYHCLPTKNVMDIPQKDTRAQTLIVVHSSKDDEKLWDDRLSETSLNNTFVEKVKTGRNRKLNKKASIFSFLSNFGKKDGGAGGLELKSGYIYETIYYPKKIKRPQLDRLQSYLSIKYGISLESSKYYNSAGDVIWDPKKETKHKSRPTGLGRDDFFGLYQKQSLNNDSGFLTIGLEHITFKNSDNPAKLIDRSFLMWSDDGGDMSIQKQDTLDVIQREWKLSFIGDMPKSGYEVRIDKDKFGEEHYGRYFILINSAQRNSRVEGRADQDYVIFSDVKFSGDGTVRFAGQRDITRPEYASTGSHAENSVQEIKLYPNPVRIGEDFHISFPETDGLEIAIYDGGGALVSRNKVPQHERIYSSQMHIQGIYIIVLSSNGKNIKTFKLIVQ